MNWALVDQSGKSLSADCQCYPSAMKSVLASLPGDSQEELLRLLQEACAQGTRRRLSITQPERPLVVVDILPLRLPENGAAPALVVVHDASEFDADFDRLRNLARRNEAILRSAMDGFFVVDADCRFLEVNQAFCRMTGYSAAELLRMRIVDLEVDERSSDGFASHTRTGLHHFPTAHRHKDGHIVFLDISAQVLHDNGVKILVGLARDVTERKRAEDELARVTRQQQLILDSAAEGIVGFDPSGRITLVNPAAASALGYRPGELIGRSAHGLFFPAHEADGTGDAGGCPICRVLRQSCTVVEGSGEFPRQDGARVPVEYSIAATRSEARAVGAVLVFRDLTERQRAEHERRVLEAQIQQAQKLESLGLLAGGIAHDLNNILAGVQGHACLALAEVSDESNLSQRLQRIVGACERASKVIRQILTYSGHVTCEAGPLELNELVDGVAEFMRATVPAKITLEVRRAAAPIHLQADGGQLQQALTNLLVNAVEAVGDKPGRITVSVTSLQLRDTDILRDYPGQTLTPGAHAAIQIEDTGCGMTPATVERLFEPFYSAKGAGRGLGLSAVRGVVRAHHGGIRVESEIDKGSRFTIVLPLSPDQDTTADGADTNADPATILVIDDEEEVREVIKDMLTAGGRHVLTAADGDEGIALFRRHAKRVELVILDMTMPGKSGQEVFRELVALRPDVKVIVVSGYSIEQSPIRIGDATPAAFLTKPFAMKALVDTVANVIGDPSQPRARGTPQPVARR